MNDRKSNNLIWYIGGVALLGYFIFLTYSAIMSNFLTNQKIASLSSQLELLQQEKSYLENLNYYYSTDTYKELEARRKLGMKMTGEKVAYIPIDQKRIQQLQDNQQNTIKNSTANSTVQQIQPNNDFANPRKWLEFVLRF